MQLDKWYNLTEKEMYKIPDLETKKIYLKLYKLSFSYTISYLDELLKKYTKEKIKITDTITIRNVVGKYYEELQKYGIDNDVSKQYVKKRLAECKTK